MHFETLCIPILTISNDIKMQFLLKPLLKGWFIFSVNLRHAGAECEVVKVRTWSCPNTEDVV